jgi:hypothetical protein
MCVPAAIGRIPARLPQPPEPSHVHIIVVFRRKAALERTVVELRVVARTRDRADIQQTFDAISSQEGNESLNRQSRMTEREYRASRPHRLLFRMFVRHDNLSFIEVPAP